MGMTLDDEIGERLSRYTKEMMSKALRELLYKLLHSEGADSAEIRKLNEHVTMLNTGAPKDPYQAFRITAPTPKGPFVPGAPSATSMLKDALTQAGITEGYEFWQGPRGHEYICFHQSLTEDVFNIANKLGLVDSIAEQVAQESFAVPCQDQEQAESLTEKFKSHGFGADAVEVQNQPIVITGIKKFQEDLFNDIVKEAGIDPATVRSSKGYVKDKEAVKDQADVDKTTVIPAEVTTVLNKDDEKATADLERGDEDKTNEAKDKSPEQDSQAHNEQDLNNSATVQGQDAAEPEAVHETDEADGKQADEPDATPATATAEREEAAPERALEEKAREGGSKEVVVDGGIREVATPDKDQPNLGMNQAGLEQVGGPYNDITEVDGTEMMSREAREVGRDPYAGHEKHEPAKSVDELPYDPGAYSNEEIEKQTENVPLSEQRDTINAVNSQIGGHDQSREEFIKPEESR